MQGSPEQGSLLAYSCSFWKSFEALIKRFVLSVDLLYASVNISRVFEPFISFV